MTHNVDVIPGMVIANAINKRFGGTIEFKTQLVEGEPQNIGYVIHRGVTIFEIVDKSETVVEVSRKVGKEPFEMIWRVENYQGTQNELYQAVLREVENWI